MKIAFLPPKINNIQLQQRNNNHYSTPLNYDRVTFGAMKKSQFKGINLAIVERFKTPIEKFNTEADFQSWATRLVDNIKGKNLSGRQLETGSLRKNIFNDWLSHLTDNRTFTSAVALLVLSSITKDLGANNDKLPPSLSRGVLSDCINEIDRNSTENPKYQFDFNKMYESKFRAKYFDTKNFQATDSDWIVIPSQQHDSSNFNENVDALKTFSNKTWCTKSFQAEVYLKHGDFHIYLENGEPKVGLRFVGDEIAEIQGEKNNSKIPVKYLNEIKSHVKTGNLILSEEMQKDVEKTEKRQKQVEKFQKDLKTAIETNDAKTIFEYFNIKTTEDKEGFLTISEYKQPNYFTDFSDIGIDENKLLEKVKTITGNANFNGSLVTELKTLKNIEGDAIFTGSLMKSLGALECIVGNATFENAKVIDLGNLQKIGGDADFRNSEVKSLKKLKEIGGNATFEGSSLLDLGELRSIGGNARFSNSPITTLNKLEAIHGNAVFRDSSVEDLGELRLIGGEAVFDGSKIRDLGKLEEMKGLVQYEYSLLSGETIEKFFNKDSDFEESFDFGGEYDFELDDDFFD